MVNDGPLCKCVSADVCNCYCIRGNYKWRHVDGFDCSRFDNVACTYKLAVNIGPAGDNVNHPSHYTFSKIEVIEAIEAWALPYHLACVVKYVARAGRKDPAKRIEDLEKASWYLLRFITNLKGEVK